MEKKYNICEANICTFKINEMGYVIPNLNEYPNYRLCVIDEEKNIAIDVRHELKYDFLPTNSNRNLEKGFSSKAKIKEGKRYAIFPVQIFAFGLSKDDLNNSSRIIHMLDNNYDFADGNAVLSNEDYLKAIKKEKDREEKIKQKIFRRKK